AGVARALAACQAAVPAWHGRVQLLGSAETCDAVRARLTPGLRMRVADSAAATVQSTPSVWLSVEAWAPSAAAAMAAMDAGAVCIVADSNPAYPRELWVDGQACHRHDGTTSGVARAMAAAFENPVPVGRVCRVQCLPFQREAALPVPSLPDPLPRVTVV